MEGEYKCALGKHFCSFFYWLYVTGQEKQRGRRERRGAKSEERRKRLDQKNSSEPVKLGKNIRTH